MVEHEHEHLVRAPHLKPVDVKTILGFAALAVLLAVVALYVVLQSESINKRLESLSASSNEAGAKLSVFEAKLKAFEATLQKRLADIEVVLRVYYDSNCTFCKNYELLDQLPALTDSLREQNIRLEAIDVKGNYSFLKRLGIKRIPAFYATASSLKKSSELSDFFVRNERLGFTLDNVRDGAVLLVPQSVLISDACVFKENIRLREFYSETCPFSKRLFHANGSAINPVNETRFKNVAEESLQAIQKEFGDLLLLELRCIPVHEAPENLATLGINKSDTDLCKEKFGDAVFSETITLADDYAISKTPTFVVDCKYVFTAAGPEKIKENICLARPDICAKLRAAPSPANASS